MIAESPGAVAQEEDFSARCADLLNASALATALGIANHTGLLPAMVAEAGSFKAAKDWAAAAGVAERYVVEIFGALVSGKVVEMDEEGLFSLPPHRAGPLKSMGIYMEEMPLLHQCAFDRVCTAAKTGDGIAHTHYAPFHIWMGAQSAEKHHSQLLANFIPSIDGGKLEARLKQGGAQVIDVGCGEGVVVNLMAKAYPSCHFVGLDINQKDLDHATEVARKEGLTNVEFVCKDLTAMEEKGLGDLARRFDLVMAFDSIHDLSRPDVALRVCAGLVKEDGMLSMVDIKAESGIKNNRNDSMAPFLYTVSLMHCMPVALNEKGMGLGMLWGKKVAVDMLKEAGFKTVQVEEMEFDSFNYKYVAKIR